MREAAAALQKPESVSFPLTKTPQSFRKKKKTSLRLFGDGAQVIIEGLQPYQPSMEALGWLRDLSNSDKHRIATYSFAGITAHPSPHDVGVRRFSNPHLLFGADEGRIGITGLETIAITVEDALTQLEPAAAPIQPECQLNASRHRSGAFSSVLER